MKPTIKEYGKLMNAIEIRNLTIAVVAPTKSTIIMIVEVKNLAYIIPDPFPTINPTQNNVFNVVASVT